MNASQQEIFICGLGSVVAFSVPIGTLIFSAVIRIRVLLDRLRKHGILIFKNICSTVKVAAGQLFGMIFAKQCVCVCYLIK